MASRFQYGLLTGVGAIGMTLGAGVFALFLGITQVQTLQFYSATPQLAATGSVNTAGYVDYLSFGVRTAFTATGGKPNYRMFSWSNPETYTGAIRSFCLEAKRAPSPTTTIDCTIVADAATGTGGHKALFKDLSLSTNDYVCSGSGFKAIIGPGQRISCASAMTGTGQNLIIDGLVEYSQTIID